MARQKRKVFEQRMHQAAKSLADGVGAEQGHDTKRIDLEGAPGLEFDRWRHDKLDDEDRKSSGDGSDDSTAAVSIDLEWERFIRTLDPLWFAQIV